MKPQLIVVWEGLVIYSKTCEYAIRALSFFAGKGKGQMAAAGEVSRATGVPQAYVAKIFQCLVRSGILSSERGPRGGYALLANPSKLSILRVVEALDDVSRSPFANCIMGLHECNDRNPCPLHDIWAGAKKRMLKELARRTVGDVAELVDQFPRGRRPRRVLSKRMRGVFSL